MKSAFHLWNRELRRMAQVLLNTSNFEKNQLKIVGVRSLISLESPATRTCRSLMCIGTDLSVSKSFPTGDVLSLHTMRRHLSCKWLILLFILRLQNILTEGQ